MPQYLLSLHTVEGETREPMSAEETQQSWAKISALNDELKSAGAWLFAGALHGPETATGFITVEPDGLMYKVGRVSNARFCTARSQLRDDDPVVHRDIVSPGLRTG
jgi:hypothetical protein